MLPESVMIKMDSVTKYSVFLQYLLHMQYIMFSVSKFMKGLRMAHI